MQPNVTAWVDRNVKKFEASLIKVAPDRSWLPVPDPMGRGFEEFGCGHYGCVLPTGRPDTVFKVTTDPAEAAFVRVAIQLSERNKNGGKWDYGEWPAGMIPYKALYQLAGAEHRKRPIFVLWREEAYEVGEVLKLFQGIDPYDKRVRLEGSALLMNAKLGAAAFRDYFDKRRDLPKIEEHFGRMRQMVMEHYEVLSSPSYGYSVRGTTVIKLLKRFRGAEKAAFGLVVYDMCIELMEHNNPLMTNVGSAMSFYRDEGIVLADVHEGNIGFAPHPDYRDRIVVITDPGHAVFLDDRYDGLTVEELQP